ncbi:MAG: hypothetical protein U5R48_11380 [Gammaproteobacteria bacterium]|nr:hypothetical protein [Gammaproteobacteria bacterium]
MIHEERSLYRNILVRQIGDERCLLFSVKRAQRNQSCVNLEDPDRLVFPYARMMLGGLLVNPEPERILMIGLGGGSITRVFHALYPDAIQDLVEIDAAVVRVARSTSCSRRSRAWKCTSAMPGCSSSAPWPPASSTTTSCSTPSPATTSPST